MGVPPEPSLTPEERSALEKGLAEFNDRLFYECHDTLEELWSGLRGPSRDFLQGLIQVAVGFYHLGNGNREGALRLLGRALARLQAYPEVYAGLAVGELREAVRMWRRHLEAGRLPDPADPPRLRTPAPEGHADVGRRDEEGPHG